MTTKVYQLPVEQTGWQTADHSGTATFTWEYDDVREKLVTLYDKGKKKQWDAAERIDWSHEPDLENPPPDTRRDHPHLRIAGLGQADRQGEGERS